ncbi:MAG: hypothetical protein KC418_19430 [Anaerolineales bacterium]|nr:hypothetical protein [Anaerolineales bacterium]
MGVENSWRIGRSASFFFGMLATIERSWLKMGRGRARKYTGKTNKTTFPEADFMLLA